MLLSLEILTRILSCFRRICFGLMESYAQKDADMINIITRIKPFTFISVNYWGRKPRFLASHHKPKQNIY